jgi:hypothetical protein
MSAMLSLPTAPLRAEEPCEFRSTVFVKPWRETSCV